MTYSNELLMKVMRQNFFKNCDRIAIVDEKRQYTYRQLDWYSDVVASLLSNYGEEPLAILLPDSSDIIITIVAAMKVQRTFIPIDCRWPAERIQYILEYSGCLLYTSSAYFI